MKNTVKKLWQAYLKHNEIYAYAQLQQFGYINHNKDAIKLDEQMSFDFK